MAHKKKKQSKQKIAKRTPRKSPIEGREATGELDMAKNGMGFVKVEGWEQDVLVHAEDLGMALHGDRVKVVVRRVSSKGRPEGVIKEVVKHTQTAFSGTIEVTDKFAFLIPDSEKMRFDIFVPLHQLNGAKNGEQVIVTITEWSSSNKNPVGEVTEVLTNQRVNEIAMKSILTEAGFPLHFSEDAMEIAARISDVLDSAEIAKRKDCRDITTLTIDPADAKDFDDAISFRILKNGNYEIGVHIADVSYYLEPNTALDEEAYQRATSVYLPDRVLPMLPEHISNELCSLRPDEDKFTFSAIFQLTPEAKVTQYWIGRTVIRSDKRFTYEQAQEIIETGKGEAFVTEVLTLNTISQKLRKERFAKGAINFSSQEIRFKLDEMGVPIGIEIKESKAAHQLIEELMLLANKTVATYVGKRVVNQAPIPFPYRVHDVPNEDKLAVFASFASRFGYKFNLSSPEKIAISFNEMLAAVQGKPEQHVLEQLGIRTMAKAIYTSDNIGHYGLGFEDYCHFTSPIRRYPDIMVHRIVQQCIDNEVKPDKKMEIKCRHCSDQERKAMEAERNANKYKQVEYMLKFVGETFDAVVSGVSSFGFWAETIAQKCEGLIGMEALSLIDEFAFVDSDYALVGMHTGLKFRIGDKVQIKVLAASLEKRQIDFGYVPLERDASKATTTQKSKTSKSSPQKSTNKKKKN